MIDSSTVVFPQNVILTIAAATRLLDAEDLGTSVFNRPLRESDPNVAVGIFPASLNPDEKSFEMRGGPVGSHEPTLSQYLIVVQALVKDMDEVRGLAKHSVLAKLIRTMLQRDPALGVALAALNTTTGGTTERAMRWGYRAQRFLSNELSGTWLYLSTLEFVIETETI